MSKLHHTQQQLHLCKKGVSCSSFYFCRWWWAILTLWLLPDRTLSRNRRNWKSCPNTTPEHSDWASNSNISTLSQEQRPAVLNRNSGWSHVPVGWLGLVWRISTHLSCQKTGSTPIWTLKLKKMGLDTNRSSGCSSIHNKWTEYFHLPPRVNLQQFTQSTSTLAE